MLAPKGYSLSELTLLLYYPAALNELMLNNSAESIDLHKVKVIAIEKV